VVVRYGMRQALKLIFEGNWALLLNNNSRELVPITNCSKAQLKMPLYCSKFKPMIRPGSVIRSH